MRMRGVDFSFDLEARLAGLPTCIEAPASRRKAPSSQSSSSSATTSSYRTRSKHKQHLLTDPLVTVTTALPPATRVHVPRHQVTRVQLGSSRVIRPVTATAAAQGCDKRDDVKSKALKNSTAHGREVTAKKTPSDLSKTPKGKPEYTTVYMYMRHRLYYIVTTSNNQTYLYTICLLLIRSEYRGTTKDTATCRQPING